MRNQRVMTDEESEIDGMNIGIEPSIEGAEAETDRDSDGSDDDVNGNLDHLPRRILCTNVLPRNECVDAIEPGNNTNRNEKCKPKPKKPRTVEHKWTKRQKKEAPIVQDYRDVIPLPWGDIEAETSMDCWQLYWTNDRGW